MSSYKLRWKRWGIKLSDGVKTEKLNRICLVLAAGMALMLAWNFFQGHILGGKFPHDSFLFFPQMRFSDFLDNYAGWRGTLEDPLSDYAARYSVFGIAKATDLVFFLFSLISSDTLAFFLYEALFAAVLALSALRFCSTGHNFADALRTIALICCSYPFWFALDRGNVEIYCFLAMLGFAVFYLKKRENLWTFFLGLAIAVKPFPVVFLALPLGEKNYNAAAKVFLSTVAVSVAGVLLFSTVHDFGLSHMFNYWEFFTKWAPRYNSKYAVHDGGIAYGHSLFGVLKILVYHWENTIFHYFGTVPEIMARLMKPYFMAACAAYLLAAAYVSKLETVLWKKMFILVCCMNLLPFVAGDYKLLHFFIPLFLFVNSRERDADDGLYALLFGLILTPKNYFFHLFAMVPRDVSENVFINPLLMCYFCWRIIRQNAAARALTEKTPSCKLT
ncbi:MAG: glycosyltransferase family 87 protein [Elusimicrobiales bacterium]|nr:glycosyltransferase family 87 protein [Elusimicrobiales bacterium]